MANGTISFAERLGSKALDSNELRRQQKNARYSPPNSTHKPFDLCPSPTTDFKRTSPFRKLQQVFEEELMKEVAGQQQLYSENLSPQADVLVDSEVELENVLIGIVSSTHESLNQIQNHVPNQQLHALVSFEQLHVLVSSKQQEGLVLAVNSQEEDLTLSQQMPISLLPLEEVNDKPSLAIHKFRTAAAGPAPKAAAATASELDSSFRSDQSYQQ
ncbi:hypothetical protein RHGRI_004967 [Rhododendron griersonianum]|uniref:Uncharacterized protein n=1 Tax=Rhododendron griersonianum TaxID=479676 RepID=A0AAV6LCF7_9ERIC|nr:hypothetical protein RHGRI_004967 [Rhododendron griersonianum]